MFSAFKRTRFMTYFAHVRRVASGDLDSLDLEAAKALLIAHPESYTATLSSRSNKIERLMTLVEKLQCMLFGAKSEKVLSRIEQLGPATRRVTRGQRHRGTRRASVGRSAHRRQALPQTAAGASATRDPYPYAGP
jgi:hypothetical protein